jgi:hypothetical protein
MKKNIISLLVFISSTAAFGTTTDFLIKPKSVGKLSMNISPDEVYKTYGSTLTKLVDQKLEGRYSPAIAIYLSNTDMSKDQPALFAEINHDKIYRIKIKSDQFKTEQGITIGTPISELKKRLAGLKMDQGEGVFCFIDRAKISYCCNEIPGYKPEDQLPASAKVETILIVK